MNMHYAVPVMVSERNKDLFQGSVMLTGLCQRCLGIIPCITDTFWKKVVAEVHNKARELPHIEAT